METTDWRWGDVFQVALEPVWQVDDVGSAAELSLSGSSGRAHIAVFSGPHFDSERELAGHIKTLMLRFVAAHVDHPDAVPVRLAVDARGVTRASAAIADPKGDQWRAAALTWAGATSQWTVFVTVWAEQMADPIFAATGALLDGVRPIDLTTRVTAALEPEAPGDW